MDDRPNTLALIGGTGFFGKSFLDAFRRGLLQPWRIARVIVVARNPDVLLKRHRDLLGPEVELVALDAATAKSLPIADYVVHAANTTDARRYALDPAKERAAILAASENFARSAATMLRGARIVYASSGAVYGQQPATVERIDEDAPLLAAEGLAKYKRDYAEAKRAAERTIAMLGSDHGLRVAVARCFAFVGPYLPRDQHFAIGNFMADGLAGRAIALKAGHPVIRSYMHADDLVRWLMAIAHAASPHCPTYNVGSDEAVTMDTLAGRIAARFGVRVAAAPKAVGLVDRYVPSIDRAATDLELHLEFDLDRAIDATIARAIDQANLVGAELSASAPPLTAVAGSYR